MKQAIMIANILGGMEYSLKTRFFYKFIIADIDLVLLPFDGSYNGRLDFLVTLNGGVAAPFWIMPYITGGVNFNFSFYFDKITNVEKWKTNAAGAISESGQFVFTPGLNFKLGLDLKISRISVGAYYQYCIKDFSEFYSFYNFLVETRSISDAAWSIFAYQSRFGFVFVYYLIK